MPEQPPSLDAQIADSPSPQGHREAAKAWIQMIQQTLVNPGDIKREEKIEVEPTLGFITIGHEADGDERTASWENLTAIPPLKRGVEAAKIITERLASQQDVQLTNSHPDRMLVNYLMDSGVKGFFFDQAGPDTGDSLRRARLVSTLRVLESEFTKGARPKDVTGWEELYTRMLSFFKPDSIPAGESHGQAARWLEASAYKYMYAWARPHDLEIFDKANERTMRLQGLIAAFLTNVPDSRKQDVINRIGILDSVTGIKNGVRLYVDIKNEGGSLASESMKGVQAPKSK